MNRPCLQCLHKLQLPDGMFLMNCSSCLLQLDGATQLCFCVSKKAILGATFLQTCHVSNRHQKMNPGGKLKFRPALLESNSTTDSNHALITVSSLLSCPPSTLPSVPLVQIGETYRPHTLSLSVCAGLSGDDFHQVSMTKVHYLPFFRPVHAVHV